MKVVLHPIHYEFRNDQSSASRWFVFWGKVGAAGGDCWKLDKKVVREYWKVFCFSLVELLEYLKEILDQFWNNCEKNSQEYWASSWDYFTEIKNTIWTILERT